MTISSEDEGQLPLDTVQRSVALVPGRTPDTTELGDAGNAMVAVPLTTLHTPAPVNGVVADIVKDGTLHKVWSGPAKAAEGKA